MLWPGVSRTPGRNCSTRARKAARVRVAPASWMRPLSTPTPRYQRTCVGAGVRLAQAAPNQHGESCEPTVLEVSDHAHVLRIDVDAVVALDGEARLELAW